MQIRQPVFNYLIIQHSGIQTTSGPGSVVGVATGYGLDVLGSNPDGDEIFRNCPDRLCGPPTLLYNGYRVFPGDK